jgi:Ca2+/Na+ antiporter
MKFKVGSHVNRLSPTQDLHAYTYVLTYMLYILHIYQPSCRLKKKDEGVDYCRYATTF